jgi:hypothetical protein
MFSAIYNNEYSFLNITQLEVFCGTNIAPLFLTFILFRPLYSIIVLAVCSRMVDTVVCITCVSLKIFQHKIWRKSRVCILYHILISSMVELFEKFYNLLNFLYKSGLAFNLHKSN